MEGTSDHSNDAVEATLDKRDWKVLALYGRAMLSAQLLEFTVFQLAHLDRRSPENWDRALRQIEGLLKQPKSDQSKDLSGLPASLRDDVRLAFDVRNRLAHDGLFSYRVERAVDDDAAQMARAAFEAITAFMDDVRTRLDQLADDRLEASGIARPFLDDEEMNELMESIGRWARDERPDGTES